MSRLQFIVVLLLVFAMAACAQDDGPNPTDGGSAPSEQAGLRNPFGLEADVPEPDAPDVDAFAAQVALDGGADDVNAGDWLEVDASASIATIDGEWVSRWIRPGEDWVVGTATVKTVGERVFIHYVDVEEYLIETRREGDRLIGRSINLGRAYDNTPWVGLIVSPERIDGEWRDGRWDFRRGAVPQP